MIKKVTKQKVSRVADDYLELVRTFPLRPIRNDAEHAAATAVTGKLIGLVRKRTPGETDYLAALVLIVRDYERKRHEPRSALPRASGTDVVRHLLAERGAGVTEFGAIIGVGKSAASLILSGKRELTKSHILRLAEHFKVSPVAFMTAA